ncbi:hypothetical protein GCM10010521_71900 [Streptomyces rameus]|uniref:Uncharacterized protein n=1 Tax=Streptomyces rameus TaxID=68261 RepID=A0ABN3V8E1_9ACTN
MSIAGTARTPTRPLLRRHRLQLAFPPMRTGTHTGTRTREPWSPAAGSTGLNLALSNNGLAFTVNAADGRR